MILLQGGEELSVYDTDTNWDFKQVGSGFACCFAKYLSQNIIFILYYNI